MAERTVIVHRSFDPLQAEMLGDVLRDAGLAARVVGTRSGAAIGVGQVILHVHIEVPEPQAAQATEVIAAFLAGDGADLLRAQGELPEAADGADADDDAAAPAESARRPLIAVGVALIMQLGAAHLYVRRPWTALALFAGHLVAFGILIDVGAWWKLVAALVLHGLLVAIDAVGAVAVIRATDGAPPTSAPGALRQLAVGLAMVTGSGAAAALLGPRVPEPETRRHGVDGVGPPGVGAEDLPGDRDGELPSPLLYVPLDAR